MRFNASAHTELTFIGEALYGERWVAPLARDLGESVTQVRRWSLAQGSAPPATLAWARKVCRDRAARLLALGCQGTVPDDNLPAMYG